LPFFVACTTTLLLSMAFWRTPVVALMPDITPSEKRSQANGIINFMGGVGSIIAFLGGSRLYELNPAYPFWLGSGMVILAAVLVFLFIREPKIYEDSHEEKPGLISSLKTVIADPERSALRVFFAIFFWFVAYNAVEAFFTLFAVNHLHLTEADGTRLLGQLSLLFVIFALPSGYIGSRIGRRVTISIGIVLMGICLLAMWMTPVATLTTVLTRLPILGQVPIVGVILMVAGVSWACININSLPMVVDMTTAARLGTYTGLYYLFSTLAAIAGPNINGLIIQLSGNDYSMTMIAAPVFMLLAFIMMVGVRRGEAVTATEMDQSIGLYPR
jgi:maltose/moltooligosaccharide transporter